MGILMGVSIVMGVPQNGWLMDNPIRMDDNRGYPYLRKPPYRSLQKVGHWRVTVDVIMSRTVEAAHEPLKSRPFELGLHHEWFPWHLLERLLVDPEKW